MAAQVSGSTAATCIRMATDDRGERGEGGKDPNMADVLDDPGRQGRAGEEAEIVARHDQAGHRGAEALGDRAQA
jgi:hypothetical protein